MKRIIKILFVFISFAIITSSCEHYYNPGLNVKTINEDSITLPENQILMEYIKNTGDYINTLGVPNMVSAEDVNENLSDYFVIDTRLHDDYVEGHINGAVNVKMNNLINYFEKNIVPAIYDKIVLVCYSGQSSSYATSILRLLGYNNVYAMKYGMGSWNRTFDDWSKNISNKYANALETKNNPKGRKYNLPEIKTGKQCGAEILKERAKEALNIPFYKLIVKADKAFADSNFYIINYWPKDKYLKGHIPGAIQYTPKHDLSDTTFLNTLPTDKNILVYCFTGQNAAFTIAYLRLLGYKAFTLGFGANSFMHDVLVSREHWHGFKPAEKLHDFPLIKGEKPSNKKINTATNTNNSSPKPKKKLIKRKKKEVTGGCG